MNSAVDALALLRTLAVAAAQAPDLESGLARVTDAILDASGWVHGEAWAPGASGAALECVYASERDMPALATFRDRAFDITFEPGRGLPGRVWATQQPIWHPDVTVLPTEEFARCLEAAGAGLEAGLGVPILDGDRVIAVLTFFLPLATEADWALADTISLVATQLGALFGQQRLEQQLATVSVRLEDAEQRLAAVRRLVGSAGPTNLDDLVETLADVAQSALEVDHAVVLVVEGPDLPARYAYSGIDRRGLDRLREIIEEYGLPRAIFERERPYRTDELGSMGAWPAAGKLSDEIGPVLAVPVRVDGEVSALVCVGRTRGRSPFSQEDEARAEDLALQMAASLARATAHDHQARASALEGRLRVMTEIQDDIIQHLFGLGLQLDALASMASTDDSAAAIATGVERVNALIAEARRYLNVLAESGPMRDEDLVKGLASLVRKRLPPATTAVLNIGADDLPALDRQVIDNLLLIAREALDNAAEHADASRVAVALRRSTAGVELVIQDDGVGFDERAGGEGAGIAAMRAAADRIGATLTVFSIPGMGTTVHVVIAGA